MFRARLAGCLRPVGARTFRYQSDRQLIAAGYAPASLRLLVTMFGVVSDSLAKTRTRRNGKTLRTTALRKAVYCPKVISYLPSRTECIVFQNLKSPCVAFFVILRVLAIRCRLMEKYFWWLLVEKRAVWPSLEHRRHAESLPALVRL